MDGDLLFEKALLDKLVGDAFPSVVAVETDLKRVNEESMKVLMEGGEVRKLHKKIPVQDSGGEFIGMARFSEEWSKNIFEALDRTMTDDVFHGCYYEDILNRVIPFSPPLGRVPTENLRWAEVDTPADLEEASSFDAR